MNKLPLIVYTLMKNVICARIQFEHSKVTGQDSTLSQTNNHQSHVKQEKQSSVKQKNLKLPVMRDLNQ